MFIQSTIQSTTKLALSYCASSCGENEAGFFVTSVVLLFLVAIEQILYKRE